MLSAFPTMPSFDGLFGIQFSASEGNFTLWDCPESLFALPNQEPTFLIGSDESNQNRTNSNSNEPNQNRNNSNSNKLNRSSGQVNSNVDERKRRQMLSNRESARRSRMKKQKHLENLRSQVNWFRVENHELTNRVQLIMHHCDLMRRDNNRLKSEYAMLQQKLWAIHQVLLVREIQHVSPFG